MSIFKCKMCGGALEVNKESVATCEYCGTQQTLPRLDDDRKTNLYDRANHFRRNNEFDKAMGIYEQILNEDNTDAEAYWSLVLCRYGIEYVEDPSSCKRIPTVNRAQYTSIFDDDNYKSALQYADGFQKSIYEEEAMTINEIQKGILAISQKEAPFDVFICYKESDNNGRRTPDSVLAQDLYYQLKQEGFKVFFARITLEDKLGSAYEPYIFAALNSSKVMVVLGTKPEFFKAVWVRNEWSRYLSLIKNGAKKTLIPAYRDMDPYDLPEEFSHLQAQDMSKLGFMQDLIRGIKKITQAEEPKATVVKETVIAGGNVNIAPLLKRAFMFLEDGDWNSANEYCEKVLDIDPENAQAYLGKLMAELHVNKQEDLQDQAEPFDGHSNYQKAVRFADDSLKAVLNGCIEFINNRNEHNRLEGIYNKATRQKSSAKKEEEYKAAAATYGTIVGYRDAAALKKQCLELAENARKDAIYDKGETLFDRSVIRDIEQAAKLFESIRDWKDAATKADECHQKIDRIKREDEEKRIQDEKDRKLRTKKTIVMSSIGASIVAVLIILFTVVIPAIKYNKANDLLLAGNYEVAMEGFRELNFRDSYEKYCVAFDGLKDTYRKKADQFLENDDKINAAIWYRKAGDIDTANEVFKLGSLVYTGEFVSAGIMADGTLKYQAEDDYLRKTRTENLRGVVGFLEDADCLVGIDHKGHLLVGDEGYGYVTIEDEMNIKSYSNVVSMVHGLAYPADDYIYYVVMLLADGSVAVAKEAEVDPYPSVKAWKNIKRIFKGIDCIYGIDQSGNVYQAIEMNCWQDSDDCDKYDVTVLENVRKIVELSDNLVALTNDGSVTVLGESSCYKENLTNKCNVLDIEECDRGILILNNDGSVDLIVEPKENDAENGYYKTVAGELQKWNGIVSIYVDPAGIAGIRYDGTVHYVSTDTSYENEAYRTVYRYNAHVAYTQEIESWNDIAYISLTSASPKNETNTWTYAIGIKYDGTVVSTGDGKYYVTLSNGPSMGDGYRDEARSGGTYHIVSDWKLW